MADSHKNFAYSTVATAPSPASSGTSLVVGSGDGALFPAVPFNATIWPAGAQPTAANAEVVRVTARSTDTLTITRAQESSSARTVVVGDQIAATITAKTLTDAEQDSVYGDGSDGSVTFDGSTTILGMAPSSSVYTLTRDFFFADVTINSGVTIKTAGFRLFVNGTLTGGGSTAIIQMNGNAASGSTGATAIQNSSSSFNSGTGANGLGASGASGGTGAGTGGTNMTLGMGGAGGAGGAGSGGAGGAGATVTAPTATQGSVRSMPMAGVGKVEGGGTSQGGWLNLSGGGSGGSAGGDGGPGGGAGGGAGIVILMAKAMAGTGAVQARGGAGGNAPSGNRGGGGGGGGGIVIVLSGSVSAGAVSGWTIDANGGAKGTKQGTGVDGTDGSAGTVILIAN